MNPPLKRIAYFISSHGFGHAARSAVVLSELAQAYQLSIISQIPKSYFQSVVPAFTFRDKQVDTGCVQADFVTVDQKRSFLKLGELMDKSEQILAVKRNWLEENAIDLVISDVPSLPIKAASDVNLPSIVMSNFTWFDIYSGFKEALKHTELVALLRQQYSLATLQVVPQIHLQNDVFQRTEEVGLLSLPGKNIQEQINQLAPQELQGCPRILIYLGQYDSSSFNWSGLEALKDYLFLTRDPVPPGIQPPNLLKLDESMQFPDLIASSDLVVTKGGYSTLATAFVHAVPVLTCERGDFSEFEAVRKYLLSKDIGVILDQDPFYKANWEDSIKKALNLTVKNKVRLNGEREIRQIVETLFQ